MSQLTPQKIRFAIYVSIVLIILFAFSEATMPGICIRSAGVDAGTSELVVRFENRSLLPKSMKVPQEGLTLYCIDQSGRSLNLHMIYYESSVVQEWPLAPFAALEYRTNARIALGLEGGKIRRDEIVQVIYDESQVSPRKFLWIINAQPIKLKKNLQLGTDSK